MEDGTASGIPGRKRPAKGIHANVTKEEEGAP
jgi:hypothetical protein